MPNIERGLELAFQRVPGVVGTSVGYTQGSVDKPTYGEVCSGSSGHTEAVQVRGANVRCYSCPGTPGSRLSASLNMSKARNVGAQLHRQALGNEEGISSGENLS